MEVIMLDCPFCQTPNRIPPEKIGHIAKCGKCGRSFPTAEAGHNHPVMVTDATFKKEVLESPLPVLVDVWAPWCGPCRMIAPVVEELAVEFAGRLKVVKLNSDDNPVAPSQYQIQGIPTLLLLKNGKLVDRIVGAAPKQQIVSTITQFLAA